MTTSADEAEAAVHDLMCIGSIVRALGQSGTPEDSDNVPGALVEWLGDKLERSVGRLQEALRRMRDGAAKPALQAVPRD